MNQVIYKSFPSDTTLDLKTFLNDPKIDAELYTFLLSISQGRKDEASGQGITFISKKDFPPNTRIAQKIHKSARTVSRHLAYLTERGYFIEAEDEYIVVNPEDRFFRIPLDTLQYLLDTVKEEVLKVYIYLGVRDGFKHNEYVFTNKEICEHLGLNYQNNSAMITNILDVLMKFGLIKVISFYDEKRHPYKRLVYFSTECPLTVPLNNIGQKS